MDPSTDTWPASAHYVNGAVKTKYKFGALKRLLCPDNIDNNFVANFEQIMETLRNTAEGVATTPVPFRRRL